MIILLENTHSGEMVFKFDSMESTMSSGSRVMNKIFPYGQMFDDYHKKVIYHDNIKNHGYHIFKNDKEDIVFDLDFKGIKDHNYDKYQEKFKYIIRVEKLKSLL